MAVTMTREPSAAPPDTAERLELERVLASRSFAKTPRLSSLLAFIVAHSLEGRRENLTEQQIGMNVFGRVPGYNSSEDTIVRVTVRQLRQRLELYYGAEGADDPMRIDIAKGSYVATVGRHQVKHLPVTPVSPAPAPLPPDTAPRRLGHLTGRSVHLFLITVLSMAVMVLGAICIQQRRVEALRGGALGPVPLWQAIFTTDRKTLIVPGDAALDNFIAWEQRPVSLEQYVTQEYLHQISATASPTHKDVPLSVRSVTPMADLAFVSMLTRAADSMRGRGADFGRMEIRYARDVAIADTHDNNLVLIGSDTFNPWVLLYQGKMDFVQHYDFLGDRYVLTNKAPRSGEQSEYIYARSRPSGKEYSHIALLKNSQGVGRVLIIEGTTMGSTYGALNFITHEALYEPVMRAATDRSGGLHDFEVLLDGDLLHGGVGNTQVVALHVH